ncbi:MAG: hypothetical protein JW910_04175 [Anaerolineae bacterium]|nr:hypothetical protein [Anaerolineae bacterium]
MVTRDVVAEKLVDYMNGTLPLQDLVAWAEYHLDAPVDGSTTYHVLAYLGAADVNGFRLRWSECHEFLHQLGAAVRVNLVSI